MSILVKRGIFMKNRALLTKILVAVSFLVMVAVNTLADLIPIGGVTTREVSDNYLTLITPAPYTFAIWGVIYILLALYTLYTLGMFGGNRASQELLTRIGALFAVSSLLNALWIVAWHYELLTLAAALILLILIYLININLTLYKRPLSSREGWFIRLPMAVYFGWITVATLANVASWLVSLGWRGFGISDDKWAAAVLAAGALVGAAATLRLKDAAYGLAVIWGYAGILVHLLSPKGFGGEHPLVTAAAVGSIAFLALALIGALVSLRRKKT